MDKQQKINQLHYLGDFEIESGEILITDPCYYQDEQGAGISVKKGIWKGFVYVADSGDWDLRCAILLAYHENHPVLLKKSGWEQLEYGTGVDSGQAGFFDRQFFNDASVVKEKIDNPLTGRNLWYDLCCHRTINTELGAGVIPYGVVSSSGFGDGSYPAYAQYFGDEIIALGLDFYVLPPISFIPPFNEWETKLFDLLEMEDSKLAQFLLSNPDIELHWFINYSLYTNKTNSLKTLLLYQGNSEGLDIEYIIDHDRFETFEAIKWEINQKASLKNILANIICWKPLETALRWSENICSINTGLGQASLDFILTFATRLEDAALPLLEFWVEKGLKGYGEELTIDQLERNFEKKPALQKYLYDNLSRILIKSEAFVGSKVEIIEGTFNGFQGLVIAVKKNKLIINVTIFGRSTEIEEDVKKVKLLD